MLQSGKQLLLMCASWEILILPKPQIVFLRGHNSRETKVWSYRELSKCNSSKMAATRQCWPCMCDWLPTMVGRKYALSVQRRASVWR